MTAPSTTPETTNTAESPAPLTGTWYSTKELAGILHVDPSTLRRWRTAHPRQGPPYLRVGKRVVLYSAHDVEHWIARHRTVPEPAA
ncbi:helix-turn-helix transcriptional regulator [Streptomyces sp. SID1121]|uniref:helix-turn-helix transcriptional regulator n=1 Tax=Streptomyces sp. SID1121 TaxID=3425888 RepID=UPI004056157E